MEIAKTMNAAAIGGTHKRTSTTVRTIRRAVRSAAASRLMPATAIALAAAGIMLQAGGMERAGVACLAGAVPALLAMLWSGENSTRK